MSFFPWTDIEDSESISVASYFACCLWAPARWSQTNICAPLVGRGLMTTLEKAVSRARLVMHMVWHRIRFSSPQFVVEITLAFSLALLLTMEWHVQYENLDTYCTYVPVSVLANRFETPWRLPHRVSFYTLQEARHRIVYSALREASNEGLGHHMRTIAADVGTALRLEAAYSHHKPSHGSLSRGNADAVDRLFNLGAGHMARNFIRDAVCNIDDRVRYNESACPACLSVRSGNVLSITQVITVPRELSYGWTAEDEFSKEGKDKIESFLLKDTNSKSHTILQMPSGDCERHLAVLFVAPKVSAYFFHRYWDAHGGAEHVARYGRNVMDFGNRRSITDFNEGELTIVVHARRGDFFKYGRPRVSTLVYGKVIRNFMKIVHKVGGPFSKMPVAVHLYSEGKLKEGLTDDYGHDMSRRTEEYEDADGAVLDSEMVRSLIHEDHAFPHGLRVQMKISMDTIQTVHEMVSGDVFFGSESSLSSVVVQSLTRAGVVLLPTARRKFEAERHRWKEKIRNFFDGDSGALLEEASSTMLWKKFSALNTPSVRRALRSPGRKTEEDNLAQVLSVRRPAMRIEDDDEDDSM